MEDDQHQGALYARKLDDGRVLVVYRMIYNDRLCVGPHGAPYYDRGWCYPQDGSAIAAAAEWGGDGTPPGPIIKEVGT